MERGEDGGERAAQGVTGEDRSRRTRLRLDPLDGGHRQPVGVFGEPEPILAFRWKAPFEEKTRSPLIETAADDADLRQKIPDVGALERRRR